MYYDANLEVPSLSLIDLLLQDPNVVVDAGKPTDHLLSSYCNGFPTQLVSCSVFSVDEIFKAANE